MSLTYMGTFSAEKTTQVFVGKRLTPILRSKFGLKRATWDHYRTLALSDDEATAMQCLAERLREALAEQGYAPR